MATDLNALARSLGAIDVRYRSQLLHGYTEWSARGAIVQVALSRTDGRRRSTLAHECSHLVLDPLVAARAFAEFTPELANRHRESMLRLLGSDASVARKLASRYGVERLCDMLAVELLLPASTMERVGPSIEGLAQVAEASQRYRVSLAMLVVRMNEFDRPMALVRLARSSGGSWLGVSLTGIPTDARRRIGRVVCSSTTKGSLDSLARGTHRVGVTLCTDLGEVVVQAEVRVAGTSALLLTSPSEVVQTPVSSVGRSA